MITINYIIMFSKMQQSFWNRYINFEQQQKEILYSPAL